ncbi:MAG: radical SAM family heme chaperone HemW [Lachnospiraceae bacterium]|nr:radical SAM family heme chaperone HemW [Lachnospiraceae bacterium]
MHLLGVYIHIPFCKRKCNYCDFLSVNADEGVKNAYVEALVQEIKNWKDKYRYGDREYSVQTIYIGGGTPSVLIPLCVQKILVAVKNEFNLASGSMPDIEVTIEVNPGTVDKEKLKIYREAGINRLSIGLQSANDNELKLLGRIHSFDDFIRTYEAARECGFDNINVDVMTAIPGQTKSSLKHTLDVVCGIKPEHISAYSLILEEGTPFYERYPDRECLFSEDEEREMYRYTVDFLKEHDYNRYEISNFSLKGFESRHNTSYWKRIDYIGFGAGASSLINGIRYRNTANIGRYMDFPVSDKYFDEYTELNRQDIIEEFMFLGLRMSEGVSEYEFMKQFGIELFQMYGEQIGRLCEEGLITKEAGRIHLTDKGIDYGNYVFSRFLK